MKCNGHGQSTVTAVTSLVALGCLKCRRMSLHVMSDAQPVMRDVLGFRACREPDARSKRPAE